MINFAVTVTTAVKIKWLQLRRAGARCRAASRVASARTGTRGRRAGYYRDSRPGGLLSG